MPCDKFDPDCGECRPKLLNQEGKPLPEDSLEVQALNKVWREAPAAQKEGLWRLTAKRSEDPADAKHAQALWTKVAEETARARAGTAN